MFNEKLETVKSIAKVCGQIATQMACGGVLAAVLPPNISVPFKVVYFIGGGLVAMATKNPVDKAIEVSIDDIETCIKETKQNIKILMEKEQ